MRNKGSQSIILLVYFMTINVFGQSENPANRYIDAYKKYLSATCPIKPDSIKHFVYFARDRELIHNHPFLNIQRFEGAQIMYPWEQLEPEKGKYDFSIIKEDYNYLLSHGKKLFIQLQDATFSPKYVGIPGYLLTDEYEGGSISQFNDNGEAVGWVAKRWNPKVQKRFALLLEALGKEFDGKVEGIPLQDKGYLRSIYDYGQEIGVGLGGPDLMIKQRGQLNHTIAMMHEGEFTIPLGIAIQDGNYIGETGNNNVVNDRKNIVPLLHAFAKDFLKVKYMFWAFQEPYFSEDVIPCFTPE